MTRRLLVTWETGVRWFDDFWVATRPDCIEMANLLRWAGAAVWMEAWK